MFASYALLWLGFFYCRYGQRCFGTAWNAEKFQKHYHISSISLGSGVPQRLQCQIETWQKKPGKSVFL